MQNAAPTGAFWAVSELGHRWGPPELARGGFLGPLHTGLLQATSAFSAKEKTFGVGFKPSQAKLVLESTSQAAVPTEPEADKSVLGHMVSLGLGEK